MKAVKAWAISQKNKLLMRDIFNRWLLWDKEQEAKEFAEVFREDTKAIPVLIIPADVAELTEGEWTAIKKELLILKMQPHLREEHHEAVATALFKLLTALGMEE